MSPVARNLAAFAVVLVVLLGTGTAAGRLIDPDPPGGEAAPHASAANAAGESTTHGGEDHESGAATGPDVDRVRGLAVADNGLRLVVDDPELRRGASERLRFRIVDERGRAVRDFDVEHTKRMHVIVARRDLTGFQHLHPTIDADGTWSTALRVSEAGSYRVFADFSHEGRPVTLAADLRVDGAADLRRLPAPKPVAAGDGGYDVRLDATDARPGRESTLRFTVTEDGRPVQVERYLGAGGHLVALREGDLAFLHVHPVDGGHGETAAAGGDESIGFAATFPTAGRYRLFLQFQVGGRVKTVAFTQEVE